MDCVTSPGSDITSSPPPSHVPTIDLSKIISDTIVHDLCSDSCSDSSDDLSSLTDVFDPAQYSDSDSDYRPSCAYQSPTSLEHLPHLLSSSDVVALDITLNIIPQCEDITNMLSDRFYDDGVLPVTPVTSRTTSLSDSFTCDSRFNDSLGALLSSPDAKDLSLSELNRAINDKPSESKSSMFPQDLFHTLVTQPNSDIFTREHGLQERFVKLEPHFRHEVLQMSDCYRQQASVVEMERFKMFNHSAYSVDNKCKLNLHFDSQLHDIMDRVEQSLTLLEESLRPHPKKKMVRVVKPRPLLSKKAVRIMETWYDENLDHPYPTTEAYDLIAADGEISVEQVKKWFANKRNRSHNTRTLTEIAKKKRQIAMKQFNL